MNDETPPLAPEDTPFDRDEDEKQPFTLTRWWTLLAILIIIALIAALASPIIFNWL